MQSHTTDFNSIAAKMKEFLQETSFMNTLMLQSREKLAFLQKNSDMDPHILQRRTRKALKLIIALNKFTPAFIQGFTQHYLLFIDAASKQTTLPKKHRDDINIIVSKAFETIQPGIENSAISHRLTPQEKENYYQLTTLFFARQLDIEATIKHIQIYHQYQPGLQISDKTILLVITVIELWQKSTASEALKKGIERLQLFLTQLDHSSQAAANSAATNDAKSNPIQAVTTNSGTAADGTYATAAANTSAAVGTHTTAAANTGTAADSTHATATTGTAADNTYATAAANPSTAVANIQATAAANTGTAADGTHATVTTNTQTAAKSSSTTQKSKPSNSQTITPEEEEKNLQEQFKTIKELVSFLNTLRLSGEYDSIINVFSQFNDNFVTFTRGANDPSANTLKLLAEVNTEIETKILPFLLDPKIVLHLQVAGGKAVLSTIYFCLTHIQSLTSNYNTFFVYLDLMKKNGGIDRNNRVLNNYITKWSAALGGPELSLIETDKDALLRTVAKLKGTPLTDAERKTEELNLSKKAPLSTLIKLKSYLLTSDAFRKEVAKLSSYIASGLSANALAEAHCALAVAHYHLNDPQAAIKILKINCTTEQQARFEAKEIVACDMSFLAGNFEQFFTYLKEFKLSSQAIKAFLADYAIKCEISLGSKFENIAESPIPLSTYMRIQAYYLEKFELQTQAALLLEQIGSKEHTPKVSAELYSAYAILLFYAGETEQAKTILKEKCSDLLARYEITEVFAKKPEPQSTAHIPNIRMSPVSFQTAANTVVADTKTATVAPMTEAQRAHAEGDYMLAMTLAMSANPTIENPMAQAIEGRLSAFNQLQQALTSSTDADLEQALALSMSATPAEAEDDIEKALALSMQPPTAAAPSTESSSEIEAAIAASLAQPLFATPTHAQAETSIAAVSSAPVNATAANTMTNAPVAQNTTATHTPAALNTAAGSATPTAITPSSSNPEIKTKKTPMDRLLENPNFSGFFGGSGTRTAEQQADAEKEYFNKLLRSPNK